MKLYVKGKKVYQCDLCGSEVWSLICKFINGEWLELCHECHYEGRDNNVE